MFLQFTQDGRWYLRNEAGQIVSKMFLCYSDLLDHVEGRELEVTE